MRSHRQDWEELGSADPLWAIYSDPSRKFNKWQVEDFFATGAQDVSGVMRWIEERGVPEERGVALDFGCGVGRLSRALGRQFRKVYGIDIAGSMIVRAKELNREIANCEFLTNDDSGLGIFPDDYFDLIYTRWVLQHMPDRSLIRAHIASFVRCIKPGGLLVFQFRTQLSFTARLQLGRRLYSACRAMGVGERFLYNRFGLNPIRMTTISDAEVSRVIDAAKGETLAVERYSVKSGRGSVFYVTK